VSDFLFALFLIVGFAGLGAFFVGVVISGIRIMFDVADVDV
jgi:hypothetical protein